MRPVDLFVGGALVICLMRILGHKGAIYKSIAHVYVGLMAGIGLGMFSRRDGDCKVYLIAALGMTLVEVTVFVSTVLCPNCFQAIKSTFDEASESPRKGAN